MASPTRPHELTIRVINGTPGGGGPTPPGGNNGGGPSNPSSGFLHALNSSIVARELKSIGQQAVSFAVSNIALTTGNSLSQERMQVALSTGGKLVAYGTALATGNVAAAAIMAVNDIMSTVMRATQLELKGNVERESLALSRDRAGIAFNNSRMGGAK